MNLTCKCFTGFCQPYPITPYHISHLRCILKLPNLDQDSVHTLKILLHGLKVDLFRYLCNSCDRLSDPGQLLGISRIDNLRPVKR